MLHYFYIAVFILNIVIFVKSEGIYTIIAPGTLHPYFKYNVAVLLHNADGPCEIEIAITSHTYYASKIVNILPMSIENVEFDTMQLERDNYELTIRGISGIDIDNTTNLNFEDYNPVVLMQTDKPIYGPGELVQFRIIFLDEYAHPEELKKTMYIAILDDAYNTIKFWKNFTLTHGVYTGKFQLSDIAIESVWQIVVSDGDKRLASKNFEINKYQLPRFDVSVDVPNRVSLSDEVLTITVKSKYTFGKPVKGKAYITIENDGDETQTKKTITIDGKGYIDLNIWKDIPGIKLINKYGLIFYTIYATVEETLTGDKRDALRSSVCISKNNVELNGLNSPTKFQAKKPITYMVIGKKFDGSPIRDMKRLVELRLNEYKFYSNFNESGIATFNLMLPKEEDVEVFCKYRSTTTRVGSMKVGPKRIPPERFELNIRTEKLKLKKDLLIEVTWTEQINYFIYIVTARGNIVKVERIEVPIGSKSYTIKIRPTLEMIPESKILVLYIYDDNLRFEEETFEFQKDFQNFLNITTVAQADPGDDIEFKISTDPYSYVGLLAVDEKLLLLKSGHDFEKDDIFHGLEEYQTETPPLPGRGRYPGKISGLVTLTNAHFPFFYPFNYYTVSPAAGGRGPRTRFPATWIFENLNITNQTEFSYTKKIPDTITSWVVTGFSMNSKTGIALTEYPTKIQVFKPFFININLPYSVKQGEVISISVLIFNYLNDTIDAEVIMENSDKEYEFVEAINDNEVQPIDEMKRIKHISLSSNDLGSLSFMIKPTAVGIITIKVTALTALADDIVHRKLKVEPEGITQYKNKAIFINLNKKPEHSQTLVVDLPSNAVRNSEHLEFSAVGDLVGLSIKHIENLVRLPIGTGEQNMIHFVPSILVLKYLKTTDQKMPNVTKTALNILKIGFQREMHFRNNDGSFSTYGRRDIAVADEESEIPGCTWLTAYVVKSFQQAAEFIRIHRPIIMEALEFLASRQTRNGNFAEYGQLLEFPYMKDTSLTAFVLLAFVEMNKYTGKYDENIKKGIKFLVNNLDETNDVYALSLSALVLKKSKHPLADKVLTKLRSFAKNQNGLIWWSTDSKKQPSYGGFNISDIEITSYALQAILLNELEEEEVLPIVKWLTMQRNSNGGFKSTQDTVVGLEALIAFAAKTGLARQCTMNIDFVCHDIGIIDKGTIKINPGNSMVLNTHVLPKNTRQVTFTAKGNSSSLVQLSYSYNTIEKELEPEFRLSIHVKPDTPPKQLLLNICVEYDADSDGAKTNMIVMEVALPSGYTTQEEKLEKLRHFPTILFTETKKSGTIAIIYLNSLQSGVTVCLLVEATMEYDVANHQPTPVVLYDYQNKKRRSTVYYQIKTSLCDICEVDDCASNCRRQPRETTALASIAAPMQGHHATIIFSALLFEVLGGTSEFHIKHWSLY